MERQARGRWGEDKACEWLEDKGFQIVARNVRYKVGEIDIIAFDKATLCFVEVRSKEKTDFGTPKETVGVPKQMRLIKAAQLYLQKNFVRQPFCRFDVISIVGYSQDVFVEHIQNAFEMRRIVYGGSPWQAC